MVPEGGPHVVPVRVDHRGPVAFPRFSARPGRCAEPLAFVDGEAMCPRSPNNLLLVDAPRDLPGWRPVGAQARWTEVDGTWRPHDASLMGEGQHRWWGTRDHLRLWHAGRITVGQAHREDWVGLVGRRHRVLGLDAARDALADSLSPGVQVSRVAVGPPRPGFDGRALVAVWPADA